jgi:hypothetical protein
MSVRNSIFLREWIFGLLMCSWLLCVGQQTQAGVVMTATDLTMDAGQPGQITVSWSSTSPLKFLSTEFILTAVTGPSVGVSFKAIVAVPDWTGNYVFAGDSSSQDFYNDPANVPPSNPASVYATIWTNDSYNYADSSLSGNDVAQDGTRRWVVLDLESLSGISGTYQLTFGSSEYDFTASGGTSVPLTNAMLSGGLITINNPGGGGGAVPEPTSCVMFGGLIVAGFLNRRRLVCA